MEYRWHMRKPMRLDVVLYYRGTRLLQCAAKDISLQGMFLNTGPAFFAKNVPVEVAFSLPDADGNMRHYHMRAVVVHGEAGGIGIMFRDYDTSLGDALRQAEHAGRARPTPWRHEPVGERVTG
ncbi:PilZ domain-containing protein [Ectothiorhodospiraceae bacterium 2226]|nr:PilZ domain-containing protein [Ectothiorhodospiraceae bacterium 2226]